MISTKKIFWLLEIVEVPWLILELRALFSQRKVSTENKLEMFYKKELIHLLKKLVNVS